MQADVPVTQADRDAAAELAKQSGSLSDEVAAIESGSFDERPLVQAFARHRNAALASIGPDAGIEAAVKVEEDVGPLVEFFRDEGYHAYGHRGDYEHWSPEETAVHFLREHLACKPPVSVDEAMVERLAVETSDRIILNLDIGEDDPRLSKLIDDLRVRLRAVLSMNTGSEDLPTASCTGGEPVTLVVPIGDHSLMPLADDPTFHAGYEQAIEDAARHHDVLADKAQASWEAAQKRGTEFANHGQDVALEHRRHAAAIRSLQPVQTDCLPLADKYGLPVKGDEDE